MEPLKPYNYVEPTRPDPPETAPRPAGAAQSPAVTPHAPGSAAHAPASGPEPLSGGPEQPAQRRRWHRGGATGIGAAVLAFAAKAKVVLLALGHVKLLVTVGSMVISIAAYASIWGLPFALGFVALLFVHEMGHVIAIKFEGGKASWPFFIPFMGAMIAARSFGDDAAAEARVGRAGAGGGRPSVSSSGRTPGTRSGRGWRTSGSSSTCSTSSPCCRSTAAGRCRPCRPSCGSWAISCWSASW
jgi:hypothetical protein